MFINHDPPRIDGMCTAKRIRALGFSKDIVLITAEVIANVKVAIADSRVAVIPKPLVSTDIDLAIQGAARTTERSRFNDILHEQEWFSGAASARQSSKITPIML